MDALIYVIGITDSFTAPVKIGTATNVALRLTQIQRGESTPLKVHGMIGDPSGRKGPRWRPVLRSTKRFKARHPVGL